MENYFTDILDKYPVKELSMLKKIAIKQEVSSTFERFEHNYMLSNCKEGAMLGAYICLVQANPEYIGNYIQLLRELVPEEELGNAVGYFRMGEIPYYLFVNKAVADVKSTGGMYNKNSVGPYLASFLTKTMRASLIAYERLHTALMEDYDTYSDDVKEAINFGKAWRARYSDRLVDEYYKAAHPETQDARKRFMSIELSIFTEVMLDMSNAKFNWGVIEAIEKGELPCYFPLQGLGMDDMIDGMSPEEVSAVMSTSTTQATPTATSAGGTSTVEAAPVKKNNNASNDKNSNTFVGDSMSCFATKLLGWGVMGETPEELEEHRKKQREMIEQAMSQGGETDENASGAEYNDKVISMITSTLLGIDKKLQILEARITELENKSIRQEKYNDITSGQNKGDKVDTMSNENKYFILKKVAKDGSSRVMWKGKYNSLEEAEQRKKELCNNPDIIKNFDFVIEPGK